VPVECGQCGVGVAGLGGSPNREYVGKQSGPQGLAWVVVLDEVDPFAAAAQYG
jgi:hypothetical protein